MIKNRDISSNRSPLRFVVLLIGLSVPFWLLGALGGKPAESLGADLPVSAFMAVCPPPAAMLLVRGESRRPPAG
ncbi:hypothetical protein ACFYSC_25500 [Streptosporangium sp. NPDC004379]|uniref:hypothetical protein n=1 Tax=Streptosporangium sp. NPDC004379 TaxID=3366189 RepID=UPI0036B0DC72